MLSHHKGPLSLARVESLKRPLSKPQTSFRHYFTFALVESSAGCAALRALVGDADIADPMEVDLDANVNDGMYSYDVKLSKYGGIIFEEVFYSRLPWDFLSISSDLSTGHYKKILRVLSESKHPFRLKIKNGELSFTDCRGQGHFLIGMEGDNSIFTYSIEQHMKMEIAGCFFNIESHQEKQSTDSQARVSRLFINYLLMLEKLSNRLIKNRNNLEEEKSFDDAEYLMSLLSRLRYIYENIVEPVVPELEKTFNHVPTTEEGDAARKCLIQFRLFYADICRLLESKGKEASEIMRDFMDCFEMVGIAGAIPSLVSILFSSTKLVGAIRAKIKDFAKQSFHHYSFAKEQEEDFIKDGLLWRCSPLFLSLLRDDLCWKIIEYAIGRFSAFELDHQSVFIKRKNLMRAEMIDGFDLAVFDKHLSWQTADLKLHEAKFPGCVSHPSDVHLTQTKFVAFVEAVQGFPQLKCLLTADLTQLGQPEAFSIYKSEFNVSNLRHARATCCTMYLIEDDDDDSDFRLTVVDLSNCSSVSVKKIIRSSSLFGSWNDKRMAIADHSSLISKKTVSNLSFGVLGDALIFQYLSKSKSGAVDQTLLKFNISSLENPVLLLSKVIEHPSEYFSMNLSASAKRSVFLNLRVPVVVLPGSFSTFSLVTLGQRISQIVTWSMSEKLLDQHLEIGSALSFSQHRNCLQIIGVKDSRELKDVGISRLILKFNL